MEINQTYLTRFLLSIFFTLTLIELFIGGGGRVFELGNLTLRIILFFFNLFLVTMFWLQRGKIPFFAISLATIVTVVLIFYSILGWLNNANFSLIIEDIKPLTYFLSILFFSFFIDTESRVKFVIKLLKISSLLLAVIYCGIQILIYFKFFDFLEFYFFLNRNISMSDFIFRGKSGVFYYKGFAYMVVGLIFWIHSDRTKYKNISTLIILIAMILTGTRGFVVMFFLVYALFYGIPYLLRLNLKFLILALIIFLFGIYVFSKLDIGDKIKGDFKRFEQLDQVVERITLKSFFIGHGFGVGVPVRKVHMEIGYLEVFHKQGILGLFLWLILLIHVYNQYKRKTNFIKVRKAFFISVMFFFLLSATNPYFNNPIGISLIVLSISSYAVLNGVSGTEEKVFLTK